MTYFVTKISSRDDTIYFLRHNSDEYYFHDSRGFHHRTGSNAGYWLKRDVILGRISEEALEFLIKLCE